MVQIIGRYSRPIYNYKRSSRSPTHTKSLTMVDPETSWFEIIKYIGKQADIISNLVDKTWFWIYLRPTIIAYDRGNELLIHEF